MLQLLTETELQLLKSLNVEEAVRMHKIVRQRRTLISAQEAKYRRIKEIKSKKYRKLARKSRGKTAETKLMENEMENNNDRRRALERATLKHKNTGKWARFNRIRSKFDLNARAQLNEQNEIYQQMMKKHEKQLESKSIDDNLEQFNDKKQSSRADINFGHPYNPYICANRLIPETPFKEVCI